MFHDDYNDPNTDEFGDALPKSISKYQPRHGYTIQLECRPKYYVLLTKEEWRQLTLFLEKYEECRTIKSAMYAGLSETCQIVILDWIGARVKKIKWPAPPKTPNERLREL